MCINGKLVLSRKLFVWNANEFCKKFKEKTTTLEFVEEWKAWQNETQTPSESQEMPPAKKARVEDEKEDSDKWMDGIDLEIERHRVG